MAQLSEYEINQINKSISNFYDIVNRITKILQRNSFSNSFRDAQAKLSSYTDVENRAIDGAKKAMAKAMKSSGGFFSSEGLNKILDKKVNDSAKQVEDLFDEFMSDISSMMSNFPKLCCGSTVSFSFSKMESKKEYRNFNFDFNGSGSSEFNTFSNKHEPMEDGEDVSEQLGKVSTEEESSDINNLVISEYTTDKSLAVLGINAISNPNFKKIRLSNVKEIYANAFIGSNNLELIVISNSIEKINVNAFRKLNSNCVIAFECSKDKALSLFQDTAAINGKKVIFDYKSEDDILNKSELYVKSEQQKKIIIKKDTPLDNDEIKQLYIDRNQKYSLTIDELNEGIKRAGTNIDKEKILYHASLARRKNALNEGSFWDYANAVWNAIDLIKASQDLDNILSMIFGLLYLDSSGYRMVDGKYNPFMQDPSMMCYHPKMEFGILTDLIAQYNLSDSYLVEVYNKSLFVKELNKKFDKPYYSIKSSIKLMLMAIKMPGDYFYPAKSGIKRLN